MQTPDAISTSWNIREQIPVSRVKLTVHGFQWPLEILSKNKLGSSFNKQPQRHTVQNVKYKRLTNKNVMIDLTWTTEDVSVCERDSVEMKQ